MRGTKAFTIRLPHDLAEMLSHAAEAEGTSQAAFIREAIDRYIELRKSDPVFRAKVRREIARLEQILGEAA